MHVIFKMIMTWGLLVIFYLSKNVLVHARLYYKKFENTACSVRGAVGCGIVWGFNM
jgi:hypothetical protein